jgi:hypothetical protein
MHPDILIEVVLWMVGGLLAALVTLIGWGIGAAQKKVDAIATQLEKINETLGSIERDLRGELAGLDRRVSQIQVAIKSLHPNFRGLDSQ